MTNSANPVSAGKAGVARRQVGHVDRPDQIQVATAIELGTLASLPDKYGLDTCKIVCMVAPAIPLGDLSAQDASWVAAHLATCAGCEDELRTARLLDRLLSQRGGLAVRGGVLSTRGTEPLTVARQPNRDVLNRATVWTCETPVGTLFLAASNRGVCEVSFAATTKLQTILASLSARGFVPEVIGPDALSGDLLAISQTVQSYLAGTRRSLGLPVDLSSVSPFTRIVLDAATTIPFGQVETYGTIASRIGKPGASRAVGNALGRNPVPLIIPCHRVVRSDLTAGGFVGGTAVKQRLLKLEGAAFVGS